MHLNTGCYTYFVFACRAIFKLSDLTSCFHQALRVMAAFFCRKLFFSMPQKIQLGGDQSFSGSAMIIIAIIEKKNILQPLKGRIQNETSIPILTSHNRS